MTWPAEAPAAPPPAQQMSYQPPPDPYQAPAPTPQYQTPAYQPPMGGALPPKPDNNLVLSIICLVLCCLPLGIVALIKSTQVDTLYAQGRYAEAQDSANAAKKWAIVGFCVPVVIGIIYVAFILLTVGLAGLGALGSR